MNACKKYRCRKKTESTYEKLITFFFIEKQINSENVTLTYENAF